MEVSGIMVGMEQIPLVISGVGLVLLLLLEQAIPAVRRDWSELIPHGRRNISIGVANGVVLAIVAVPLLTGLSAWIERSDIGLIRLLDEPWRTAVGLLLFDGWMYLWHRANHEVGFLWRFHRLHHSDPAMDVTTTFRFHPGEIGLSTLARLVVTPLLGLTTSQLILYETLMFPVILLHHSNLRFVERYDRLTRWLIVTPALHRIHHSRIRIETDSNYGSVLTVWDRLSDTFRLRGDGSAVSFGLDAEISPSDGKETHLPFRTSQKSQADSHDLSGT